MDEYWVSVHHSHPSHPQSTDLDSSATRCRIVRSMRRDKGIVMGTRTGKGATGGAAEPEESAETRAEASIGW